MTVDPISLLRDLVRVPSPSGNEIAAALLLAEWGESCGLTTTVDDSACRFELAAETAGPTLLFASHLDTVSPGDGWSIDPFEGFVESDRLVGRGAVDAKASVSAMAAAVATVKSSGGPNRGRLVFLATYGEETRTPTMPDALNRLESPPDAAVIGEPTGLRPCIAQRGLIVLRLSWAGEQIHAGWAAEREPAPALAIPAAARDLVALTTLELQREHPLLGRVAFTPTVVRAGESRQMTPSEAEAFVDVRTTPDYSANEILGELTRVLEAKIDVISDHRQAVATPERSPLLAAMQRVAPESEPFGSPTCSDWIFMPDLDAIKLGPGDSSQSHTADESIALSEVQDATRIYTQLTEEYLS